MVDVMCLFRFGKWVMIVRCVELSTVDDQCWYGNAIEMPNAV
jgi:hypothetical protein